MLCGDSQGNRSVAEVFPCCRQFGENVVSDGVGRLPGVDVARALAIVGMVAVHFGPRPQRETGLSAWLLGVPYGKASVLFALVAGVGVSLLAARKPALIRPRLLYRTLWLLPVGLWLQELEHPVAVILQYYAVWFAIAAIYVHASDRRLLVWAGGWLAFGSLAVAWVGVHHADWLLIARGDSPGGVVMDVLLTGYYPTVTWIPVVLFGMWLGRRGLGQRRVRATMVAAGGAVALVAMRGGLAAAQALDVRTTNGGWGHLLSIDGHSEMPLAVIGASAMSVAVLGVCLWAADVGPRLLRPLVAMGQGALTLYVGHLIIWNFLPALFASTSSADAWTATFWFTVVGAASMTLWLLAFSRGPLETMARAPWQHVFEPLIRMASGETPTGRLPDPPAGPVGSVRNG
jgi:uncharacterized membrane protein YeiB